MVLGVQARSSARSFALALLLAVGCAGSPGAQPDDSSSTPQPADMESGGSAASPTPTDPLGASGSQASAPSSPAAEDETPTPGAPAAGSAAPTTPVTMPSDPPTTPAMETHAQRIYWLDILGNGVFSALPDGSDMQRISAALAAPDGVVADDCSGAVYFTNMGSGLGGSGQASVQRFDDGTTETLIEPNSGINTAKQMTIDVAHGHLYIADREGATIWRSALDGSELEPVVREHGFSQLVGVAVDPVEGHVYFTDRNNAQLFRVGLELPAGESAANRTDLEMLYAAPDGAMLIDLAIDLDHQTIYVTDRNRGTVERMGLALPAGETSETRSDVDVVIDGLTEPIGVAVAPRDDLLYVTELGGAVHRAGLDGSGDAVIAQTGSATGIAVSMLADPSMPLTCE
jgi:sugar lactone lactonase YvrE